MLYPNNLRTGAGWGPLRNIGIPTLTNYVPPGGTVRNIFTSNFLPTSSVPEGYAGEGAWIYPIKAGGMSSLAPVLELQGTGNALNGGPVSGTGAITLIGDNLTLSIVMSMDGTGAITLSGNGNQLKLTIGLDGSGTFTFTGDGNSLALIVPFEGLGSFTITGISDLKGRLSMSGEWTPFTELSPQNLATAVWESVAADNNNPGTMGEKLNGAGSAGNPWTEVIESGLTASQVMRIILSVLSGETTIDGNEYKFKSVDGTVDRVTAIVETTGRTTTIEGD